MSVTEPDLTSRYELLALVARLVCSLIRCRISVSISISMICESLLITVPSSMRPSPVTLSVGNKIN